VGFKPDYRRCYQTSKSSAPEGRAPGSDEFAIIEQLLDHWSLRMVLPVAASREWATARAGRAPSSENESLAAAQHHTAAVNRRLNARRYRARAFDGSVTLHGVRLA
jgi:hypothetical protein